MEFIDILRTTGPGEDIATLDVENLFTNVPINETIEYICDKVYRGDKEPIPIPEKILRDLLYTCTSEVPFLSHRGELFRQAGGVSMGSPLGCLFAEMYMAKVEERTFRSIDRPRIYVRFRDDIFVTVDKTQEIEVLAQTLKDKSILNFTVEQSINDKVPFLDVSVNRLNNRFKTNVYTKPTNVGRCLNANGECSDTYKQSVVSSYVNRALSHNQDWAEVDRELSRVRQLLTNNGYNGNMIEKVIAQRLNIVMNKPVDKREKGKILTVYHQMTYGSQHEQEAEVLRKIVHRGVEIIEPFEKLSLRIFCRPRTISSLIMRNSTTERTSLEQSTNVVYSFKCSVDACQHRDITYIGLTTTTLRRRMLAHRNNGGINSHYTKTHDRKPLLDELLKNTTIIHRENIKYRLNIAEAVSIAIKHPALNTQKESDYILPSARRRTAVTQRNEPQRGDEDQEGTEEVQVVGGNHHTQPTNEAPRGRKPRGRGSTRAPTAPRDAPQGHADAQPDEDVVVLSERILRPRRGRPTYTE